MLPLELAGTETLQMLHWKPSEPWGLSRARVTTPTSFRAGKNSASRSPALSWYNPTVLFADEPTGNLDQRTGENVIELLFRLNRNLAPRWCW